MTPTRCAECSATYATDVDSCMVRFHHLLALDHSRREPWGSRHGQAFAAFALQHPETYAASLDRAWAALWRIYVAGEPPAHVFAALRDAGDRSVPGVPRRPERRTTVAAVTIADLDDFAPATYPERLDAWCRAALAAWGVDA